jgi:hypothetical protein
MRAIRRQPVFIHGRWHSAKLLCMKHAALSTFSAGNEVFVAPRLLEFAATHLAFPAR